MMINLNLLPQPISYIQLFIKSNYLRYLYIDIMYH